MESDWRRREEKRKKEREREGEEREGAEESEGELREGVGVDKVTLFITLLLKSGAMLFPCGGCLLNSIFRSKSFLEMACTFEPSCVDLTV